MKTAGSTGEVSLPSAHGAGWNVKARAQQGGSSEKSRFGVEKRLVKPRNESIIVKTTGKTQT
jgi:hypothetical protein